MRVIRKPAYQGHAIPTRAGYARNPFEAEVLAQPTIVTDDNDPDVLYPPGATAQNDYRGLQFYRCRECGMTVSEDDLDNHVCEDFDGED